MFHYWKIFFLLDFLGKFSFSSRFELNLSLDYLLNNQLAVLHERTDHKEKAIDYFSLNHLNIDQVPVCYRNRININLIRHIEEKEQFAKRVESIGKVNEFDMRIIKAIFYWKTGDHSNALDELHGAIDSCGNENSHKNLLIAINSLKVITSGNENETVNFKELEEFSMEKYDWVYLVMIYYLRGDLVKCKEMVEMSSEVVEDKKKFLKSGRLPLVLFILTRLIQTKLELKEKDEKSFRPDLNLKQFPLETKLVHLLINYLCKKNESRFKGDSTIIKESKIERSSMNAVLAIFLLHFLCSEEKKSKKCWLSKVYHQSPFDQRIKAIFDKFINHMDFDANELVKLTINLLFSSISFPNL